MLEHDELQDLGLSEKGLTDDIISDFTSAQVRGFSSFAKKDESSKYEAIVVSFIFSSLSEADIESLDSAMKDSDSASDAFCKGAQYCMVFSPGPNIGDAAVYLEMYKGVTICLVVSRREDIGQAVMVIHGGGYPEAEALVKDVAGILDDRVKEVLQE